MKNIFQDLRRKDHKRYLGGLDVFKYIGPGLLVTVGFIDPGNWASNFAAGSEFGYSLLWVVTLSTIMLIVLQHNVAHLGIVTGLCLSEAATKYTPKWVSRPILGTAVLASISTSLAEILGGAIALEMLLDIPIIWGAVLTTLFVSIMLFTNSYKKIERSIIAFVSVIGLSFIYELFLVEIDWPAATAGCCGISCTGARLWRRTGSGWMRSSAGARIFCLISSMCAMRRRSMRCGRRSTIM